MTIIDLDDFLDENGPTIDTEQVEGWEIEDDRGAEWALERLARAEREIERIRATASDRISLIEAWREQATGVQDRTADRMRTKLQGYYERLDAEGKLDENTYKLTGGTIARHKGRPSTDFTDPEAFIAWASLNGATQYVATSARPVAAVTKDRRFAVADDGTLVDTETGEPVPGVVVRTGHAVVRVTVEKPLDGAA